MKAVPEVVTFDFHNTIAHCDRWFQLEIRNLLPAFLAWHASHNGITSLEIQPEEAVVVYRRLRTEIMDHGMEMDAVTCVDEVTRELGIPIDADTIESGVRAIMHETLADATAVAGVIDGVKQLKAHEVRLGVISSAAYHPFLEWTLDKFGILNDFDTIVTSASCGYYKSRTEIYSMALSELNTIASRTVHVGDSHRFDVEPASRLGIKTVWYNHETQSPTVVTADATVSTLVGIGQLVLDLYGETRS